MGGCNFKGYNQVIIGMTLNDLILVIPILCTDYSTKVLCCNRTKHRMNVDQGMVEMHNILSSKICSLKFHS